MASMSWASLLRASIISFCEELGHIKDPDAVFEEELAALENRSRRRLENLVQNPTFRCVPSLQEQLLADNRQLIELELAHAGSRAQRIELYDEAMEELAGRMLRIQLDILGPETIKKLVPELPAAMNLDGGGSRRLKDKQPPASDCQPHNAMAGDAHVQASHYVKRWNDQSFKTIEPEANTPVTWCTLRKRGRDDPPGKSNREQIYRAPTTRASPSQKSPSPLATEVQVLHVQNTFEKDSIYKRGSSLCNKAMGMGIDGHTTCILVFKNPVNDEWVSAGHIPEGQTIPSLDTIVAEHMEHCQEVSADSPSLKVENSSPNISAGKRRDYVDIILHDGIGCAK
ncbi:hypothetical protein FPRO05_14254 [Fusarium proliferatum]|uniref:Uncharacterized protein n=1 Tax=Gibberella intermedia TaxID=948311 RepID=A0A365MTM3_GIBIN|nr:hypothetical protein FPRO05_14254 [Fusarium proliferatum]